MNCINSKKHFQFQDFQNGDCKYGNFEDVDGTLTKWCSFVHQPLPKSKEENFDEDSKNETTVENVTDAVEKVEIAKDEATKTETNSEIVPDASEIVPNAVEKVEIAEEGM